MCIFVTVSGVSDEGLQVSHVVLRPQPLKSSWFQWWYHVPHHLIFQTFFQERKLRWKMTLIIYCWHGLHWIDVSLFNFDRLCLPWTGFSSLIALQWTLGILCEHWLVLWHPTQLVSLPVLGAQSGLPGPVLTVGVADRSSRVLSLLFTTVALLLLHLKAKGGSNY